MSFKIFSQQLFGKIKPVELIEKKRKMLRDDFDEFVKVQNSDELAHYIELENFVNSDEFKKKKVEIETLQFKGSKEFNQLKELDKLKNNSAIKKYFKVLDSTDLKRYEEIKNSEKLVEFYQLQEYVKEGQFAKEKTEIQKQVFKGSVEETHWLDFKRLDKSAGIKAYKELNDSDLLKKHDAFSKSEKLKNFLQLRNLPEKDKTKKQELKTLQSDVEIKSYFKFEKSKKIKLYREISGSHDLIKYHELKVFIEKDEYKKREAFLKDKKKFEKSEAFKKYSKYKQLAADSDIKFFLNFEKSSLYKNYLNIADSSDLKRYYELEEIVSTDEFKQRKSYLEDNKKWEKTEEFAQMQEYTTLKKLPHLVKYFKYKGGGEFSFIENWDITFEDDFSKPKLDDEKWSDTSFLANKLLGDNYSLVGDLQVYTRGENLKINNKLDIQVRKERKEGKVWQMSSGFLPVEMEYTSGTISSWKSLWQEEGIFEAKIKFEPKKQVASTFYLAAEKNMPRVNLLEMGTKNRLGISILNSSGKLEVQGLDISNLKKGWYIFSVQKQGSSFIWKINESEILRIESQELNTKLHLNASSIVVHDIPTSLLPANFEIEWVKCYRKK